MSVPLGYALRRFRGKRWAAVAGAAGVILLCGVWLIRIARLSPLERERYKPDFWVVHDADSADSELRLAADTELLARLGQSKLSTARIAAVVERALKAQAKKAVTWNSYRGEFVEKARGGGYVTDLQWKKYWENAFPPFLLAPTTLVPGQPLTIEVACDPHSVMYSGSGVAVSCHATSLRLGRVQCDAACLGDVQFEVIPNWAVHSGFNPPQPISMIRRSAMEAPGGPVLVIADADVTVYPDLSSGTPAPWSPVHYTKRLTAIVRLPAGLVPVEYDFSPERAK